MEALSVLNDNETQEVLESLFGTTGCHFNICRMPIGANDFAMDWYSLNDSAADFSMNSFNIHRDEFCLIPYIQAAKKIQPDLKIWGSPWCPPAWMKKNGYYACAPSPYNDLDSEIPRQENGDTDFIMEPAYLKSYAAYFVKTIQTFNNSGIPIYAIHVQNEPHSCQTFPSCLWKGPDLRVFVRDYLGPAFLSADLKTEIWYGTFERPYEGEWKDEIDGLLEDSEAMRYISGFGFQWGGREAIDDIHRIMPDMQLMHTETECGNGKNTWKQAEYIFDLLMYYFEHGANSQMYWNMILSENPRSPWGWEQNSMITIDSGTREISYNPEFYVMKHICHFLKPGAYLVEIMGDYKNAIAFLNPDGTTLVLLHNPSDQPRKITLKYRQHKLGTDLSSHSFTTIFFRL